MLNKEDRKLLHEQEQVYKQKAKERHEELKRLNAERKSESKQARKDGRIAKKPSRIKKAPITRTLLDAFPIRDSRNDYFILDDDRIMDIFQIRGKSYYNASDEEIDAMVDVIAYFYRLYKPDIKIIGMNYPTNTKAQQAFLTLKQQQPDLEQYAELIDEKLATLQYLEQSTTDREAFIMIYAKSEDHYAILKNLLSRSGLHVEQISIEKKLNIVFQLNNMCKRVKI